MIKNRMPLTNLLFIIIMAFSFSAGCIGYVASLEKSSGDEPSYVTMGFGLLAIFTFISALGIGMKYIWARVFLLWILYFGVIGWTGFSIFWISRIKGYQYQIEQMFPFIFSIFIYCLLVGGIMFLNNSKVKNEFGQSLSQKR